MVNATSRKPAAIEPERSRPDAGQQAKQPQQDWRLGEGQDDEAEAEAGGVEGLGAWPAVMGWPQVRPKRRTGRPAGRRRHRRGEKA